MRGLVYSITGAIVILLGVFSLGLHKWMKTNVNGNIGQLETKGTQELHNKTKLFDQEITKDELHPLIAKSWAAGSRKFEAHGCIFQQ